MRQRINYHLRAARAIIIGYENKIPIGKITPLQVPPPTDLLPQPILFQTFSPDYAFLWAKPQFWCHEPNILCLIEAHSTHKDYYPVLIAPLQPVATRGNEQAKSGGHRISESADRVKDGVTITQWFWKRDGEVSKRGRCGSGAIGCAGRADTDTQGDIATKRRGAEDVLQ